MTFQFARRLFFLYAALLGAALLAGGFAMASLEPWWQRALVFYGVGGSVGFAWVFGVFAFVERARQLVPAESRSMDEVVQWGERWFRASFAVLALVAAAGIVAVFQATSWAERLGVFFGVGAGVLFAGMGVIFCFCAIPQIRARAPSESSAPPGDDAQG